MNHEFAVHRLNDEGMKKAKLIAMSFDNLLEILKTISYQGRALSICETKLEEACFYAKKSMAESLTNQDHQELCSNIGAQMPEPDKSRNFMKMNAPDEKY